MRILITNDDGIAAPGLKIAEAIAAEVAGPEGEVWVAAPDRERSGVSHCVSYTQPMRLVKLEERRYSIDGYPADCVLIGLDRLMETPPDLVISGVNRGHNIAEDVVYSGTAGGAMEGALAGIPSIALSQAYRGATQKDRPEDIWKPAQAFGVEAVRRVLQMPWANKVFYNVNFPPVADGEVKGFRVCPQGLRASATFAVEPYISPSGREFFWLKHRTDNASAAEGSDARLCVEGWITVTPLRPQLTADDLIDGARAALG